MDLLALRNRESMILTSLSAGRNAGVRARPCPCECMGTCASTDDDYSMWYKRMMPSPPLVLTHPVHGRAPHTSPASAHNESYLMKNEMYLLRGERFGSVLFDKDTFNEYLCNHTATEIL